MPQQMSLVGDRVFSVALHGRGLSGLAITNPVTVNYQCMWESFYRGVGEPPPPGAAATLDSNSMFDWWRGLSPREQEIVRRRTGVSMDDVAAAVRTSTARLIQPK
jgi:hypothetical protein